jgi:hypothetical protein
VFAALTWHTMAAGALLSIACAALAAGRSRGSRVLGHVRLRGGALASPASDGEVLASLAQAGGGGAVTPSAAAQFAQESGATFVRLNAGAAQPYLAANLAGCEFDAQTVLRDLQLTSLVILVGALFRYKVVWRAGQPVRPQMLRTLTMLLVANALRVLVLTLFVPLSPAARVAFHADADWWFGHGGTVLQTATEPASGLAIGRGVRKIFMTWFFTQGIADLVNEAPPAIRDVYVAATR